MANIIPMRGKALIKLVKEEKMTKSGIVLPDTVEKEELERGEVVAVGEPKLDHGHAVPIRRGLERRRQVVFAKLPHADEAGGLSGRPLKARATAVIAALAKALDRSGQVVTLAGQISIHPHHAIGQSRYQHQLPHRVQHVALVVSAPAVLGVFYLLDGDRLALQRVLVRRQ